jgi:membrane protease YdiL (CAAX protease family)
MNQVKQEPISAPKSESAFPDWKDILAILVVFVGVNLLSTVLVGGLPGGAVAGWGIFGVYTVTLAATIAYALARVRRKEGSARGWLRLSFRGFNPTVILVGIILMLAASVVIEPLIELFPAQWYDLVDSQLASGGWAMFTAIVMAPLCEEMLFRGIIQGGITRRRGSWAGVLIASAIFGLIHGIPQQIVAGFVLGIVMGLIYDRTGSLLSVIVLHGVNNALSVFLSIFETDGGLEEQSLRELIGSPEWYWTLYGACALLLTASLSGVIVSIRRSRRQATSTGEESAVA